MVDVVSHLRACRDRFAERSKRPVVAWDCMGASKWAEICDGLAREIEDLGLHGEQAIGFLKGRAHDSRTRADRGDQSGMGIVVSMDVWSRFDEIIDPIARDRRGWIELRGHAEHFDREGIEGMPTYRRMLGVNQCVATLSREWGEIPRNRGSIYRMAEPIGGPRRCRIESEDAWETRRQAWLGRYHPDIPVIHAEGGWERDDTTDLGLPINPLEAPRARQYTPLYGTVAQHMAEPTPTALPWAWGLIQSVGPRTPIAKAA